MLVGEAVVIEPDDIDELDIDRAIGRGDAGTSSCSMKSSARSAANPSRSPALIRS
jgi:hypothetical protein